MFKKIVFATLALVGLVNAGITTGSCPSPALQQNFDASKYLGLWFEQARDAGMPWESNDCQQARYSLNADGTVKVHNSQYNPTKDVIEEAFATATFNGAQGKVSFFAYAPPGDYRVLATDYSTYALVYSCDTYLIAKTEYIWVLTRDEKPSEAVIYNALLTLKEKVPDYDQTQIRRTLHGELYKCKYLPDAEKTQTQ